MSRRLFPSSGLVNRTVRRELPHPIKYVLILLLLLLCLSTLQGGASKLPVRARRGMVVSSHILSSQVGVETLKAGGNAIDAAIATGFALAVNLPSAGNIGGGGFMLVYRSDGEVTAFDFREKAPLAAHARMFLDEKGHYDGEINHQGYLAVGVPGTVAGFFLAHQRLGTIPMAKLIEPAVRMARQGFLVTPKLARDLQEEAPEFRKYPGSRQALLKPDGEPYQAGELWRQPELARTLRRIQRHGRDGFYKGRTARLIAGEMLAHGGLITLEDLAGYKAKERRPLEGSYRGHRIISMPPPSSGGVALIEILHILEGFDLSSAGYGSAQHLHLLAESMRRAFADRARYLGDPDFNPGMPVSRLLSREHAAQLRSKIMMGRASVSNPERFNQTDESQETTHYSVVDSLGNAVVVTYTLEDSYGSKIAIEGTGFLLNNEMGDFNPVPGETNRKGQIGTAPNLVAPGKRMMSSMTPTIVLKRDRPLLLIGSPGGKTIINTVAQVIVNVVDFEMDISEAIDAARIHHQWLPDEVKVERFGFSPDTLHLLREMGHKVELFDTSRSQGRAMGIMIDPETGWFLAASDPRSPDGAALGF